VEVLLLEREDRRSALREGLGFNVRTFSSEEALRACLGTEQAGAVAVVGATSYGSFLVATSAVEPPTWLDLNGDPIAEAQSQSVAAADEQPFDDGWWLLTTVVRRGDRFSTVSMRQRLALLGQLGALGRLNRSTAGDDLVAVVPESVASTETPGPPVEGRTVLFSGGFASWIDGPTLTKALSRILTERPELRFVATGGAVAGLDPAAWLRFVDASQRMASDRVRIMGWVDSTTLESIERDALCGIVPELPSIERELGGQNRSLRWMSRGVPVVTTDLSELGSDLARLGLARIYRPGDPDSLAEAIVELATDAALRESLARRALAWVRENRTVEVTTAPLVKWLDDPSAAGDRVDGRASRTAKRLPEMLRDQLHLDDVRQRSSGSTDDGR
jgi:glycosyltransferase involved in cell wall biosynthesis